MRTEHQPDSRASCHLGTGRGWVLAVALLCLGPVGCHSTGALPDAVASGAHAAVPAQRGVEAIADEYLSALLEYCPELGTQ